MKSTLILLFTLCAFTQVHGAQNGHDVHLTQVRSSCALEDERGNPSAPLLALLQLHGIHHDGSWPSIQQATEQAWLNHGRSKERWELEPTVNHSPQDTFNLLRELGMIDRVYASEFYYPYGVVLGATLKTVRQRFWTLKQEWDRGVHFDELVILTGDRPLDPNFEGEKELIDPASSAYPFRADWHFSGILPKNETEMMRLVFEQLDLPSEWNCLKVTFVDTPKPEGLKRPHTEHTLFHWLAMKPTPGRLLVVSNQPFVCRQDALLRSFLPTPFSMETVGEGLSYEYYLSENKALSVLLAEVAYWIKILKRPHPL